MNEDKVSWAAVIAAVLLVGGVFAALIAALLGLWIWMAFAGMIELCGLGWVLLAGRDDA